MGSKKKKLIFYFTNTPIVPRKQTDTDRQHKQIHTMVQHIDTYIRWRLETKHGLSRDDLNCLNYNAKTWSGDYKIFRIQEISKSGKSMKCQVFDFDGNKTKQYKQYSMERFFKSVVEEHRKLSLPLGDDELVDHIVNAIRG